MTIKDVWLILFAVTAGFTASGIIANLYRVLGFTGQSPAGRIGRTLVLIVAGPTVVFETALRGKLAGEWPGWLFWCVAAGLAYWSLALGLFIIDFALRL